MLRRVGSDVLIDVIPERYPYHDEGCEVSPSCLRCPLPRCKYDDPGWYQRQKRTGRDLEIVMALREQGLSVSEAAARFDVSQRTIFRILSRMSGERRQNVSS